MLIKLIESEERGVWKRIVVAAALAGIANGSTLAIINMAASDRTHASAADLMRYIAALMAYVLSLRYSVGQASKNIESALCRIRTDLANSIRRAELLSLEQIGVAEIYERMTEETSILSTSAWPLALGLQGAVMLVCMVVYLAFISTKLLVVALLLYIVGAMYYSARQLRVKQALQEAAQLRMRLFERLNDLIYGFKEVRLHTARSDDLHVDFQRTATSLKESAITSNFMTRENFVFAQLLQFTVMAAAVFALPQYVEMDTKATMSSVAALLLILGPLSQVLFVVPMYERANLAAENMLRLQERLRKSSTHGKTSTNVWADQKFAELRLQKLEFQRFDTRGREAFKVGPIDLTVRAGEIVFLVGGNGSGKTTLLRAMTALYAPTAGSMYVNGVEVTAGNKQAYREMITAIFGDFHLFRQLYGISGISSADVRALLVKMDLADKTELVNGAWKTLALSTGQRKRLAMVAALLEDRPIYVFDEWAADQDPEFRKYFYEVILPDLKKRGKAVIAISHDDRYFCQADQVVTLEYGKLRSIEPGRAPSMAQTVPKDFDAVVPFADDQPRDE